MFGVYLSLEIKMSKFNCAVITDGYMFNNITSEPIRVNSFPTFAIQYWISSSTPNATGSIKLQASCEWDNHNAAIMQLSGASILDNYIKNWVDITSPAAIAITSGSPAVGMFNLTGAGYSWIRVVYTATTGSGTLQVRLQGKHGLP